MSAVTRKLQQLQVVHHRRKRTTRTFEHNQKNSSESREKKSGRHVQNLLSLSLATSGGLLPRVPVLGTVPGVAAVGLVVASD